MCNLGMSEETRRNVPERVGDATGQSPDVEALDREKASDLANVIKDMNFPATKQEIQQHINMKSSERNIDAIKDKVNSLQDGVSYTSVSEVEKAAGLVRDTDR